MNGTIKFPEVSFFCMIPFLISHFLLHNAFIYLIGPWEMWQLP